MDTFIWSLPFMAEKVIEMFYHILKRTDNDEELDSDEEGKLKGLQDQEDENKKGILKNKVQFISKMLKMQRVLRQHSEAIIDMRDKNNHLPRGLLLEGEEGNFS
jgi:serine/threonine-protein phosphatase 2B catalytic subunit